MTNHIIREYVVHRLTVEEMDALSDVLVALSKQGQTARKVEPRSLPGEDISPTDLDPKEETP